MKEICLVKPLSKIALRLKKVCYKVSFREFGEITRQLRLLRRSGSFKVTEFGTNRKLICDFLLAINSN